MLLHGRTQFLKQTGAAGTAAGRNLAVQLGRMTRGQQPSLRLDAFLQIVGTWYWSQSRSSILASRQVTCARPTSKKCGPSVWKRFPKGSPFLRG
jgi:hypothetical protein